MNLWRMLGISTFLLGMVCFISAANYAGGQDKDKDKKDKAAEVKDKKTDDKDKKAEDKDKDKKADDKDKKAEEKKPEVKQPDKVEPKVTGGDTFVFKAFDPKGKPFFQEVTTKTKQTIKVMGQEVVQDQSQTFIIQWTPKEMAGKDYVVAQRIVGVKMSIEIGGNKISYDSTVQNQPKNPMTDFFMQLMKPENELIFTISPDLKVSKIEGRDKFIKALSDINPQMKGLLDAILSTDALTKMSEPTWWAFPSGGSATKGKTWSEKSKLDLGPIGTYDTIFDFTYAGAGKVDYKTKLKYTAPTKKEGLPFIIHDAELTSDNGAGEATFDFTKGRFSKTKLEMKLTGTLTIEVGNMRTSVSLTQSQDATTITSDENPWGAEKK
jgi:hypothetical protein